MPTSSDVGRETLCWKQEARGRMDSAPRAACILTNQEYDCYGNRKSDDERANILHPVAGKNG